LAVGAQRFIVEIDLDAIIVGDLVVLRENVEGEDVDCQECKTEESHGSHLIGFIIFFATGCITFKLKHHQINSFCLRFSR
jgi:hypothetical protein